jgi:hypothetical protein
MSEMLNIQPEDNVFNQIIADTVIDKLHQDMITLITMGGFVRH